MRPLQGLKIFSVLLALPFCSYFVSSLYLCTLYNYGMILLKSTLKCYQFLSLYSLVQLHLCYRFLYRILLARSFKKYFSSFFVCQTQTPRTVVVGRNTKYTDTICSHNIFCYYATILNLLSETLLYREKDCGHFGSWQYIRVILTG